MPAIPDAPLGLSILYLIRETDSLAPANARSLIDRAKKEIQNDALRADLIELIETIIIYKLPRLSREEIQAMLQVDDIRKSKVYQEAKEEGLKEGIEQGIEQGIERGAKKEQERHLDEKRRSISKLAALNISAEKIADILNMDIDVVRKELVK